MIGLLAAGLALAAPQTVHESRQSPSCLPQDVGRPAREQGPEAGALDAFHLLAVDLSPEAVQRLAVCLEELALPHVAQRHWVESLHRGATGASRRRALGRAFGLAEELGDLWSVAWTLDGLPESALPSPPSDALLYVHAQQLMDERKYELAAEVLSDVSESSRWYPAAQVHRGRALEQVGRFGDALDAYGTVLEHRPDVDMADLTVLRAARLYEGQGLVDEATDLLSMLPRASELYGTARVEAARMWLDVDVPPEGGAHLARRAAPFLNEARKAERRGALLPELGVLEAKASWTACRPDRAARQLEAWREDQRALSLTLEGVAGTGHPDGALVWEQHLSPEPVDVGLPAGVFQRLDANPEVAGLRRHLALVAEEEQRLGSLGDERWKGALGAYLADVLSEGRRELRQLEGELLLGELQGLRAELARAGEEADLLERRLHAGPPGC